MGGTCRVVEETRDYNGVGGGGSNRFIARVEGGEEDGWERDGEERDWELGQRARWREQYEGR